MVLRVLIAGALVCACDAVTLVDTQTSAQSAQTASALARAGVAFERTDGPAGSARFAVPRAQVADAVRAVCAATPDPPSPRTLFGAESDARTRREGALAARVRAALEGLQWVRSARAAVTLPSPAALDDRAVVPPRVLLLVEVDAPPADADAQLRALTLDLLPELRPADLRLRLSRARPPIATRFERVGPFTVAQASAGWLKLTLSAMLLSMTALSATLLGRTLRRARGAP